MINGNLNGDVHRTIRIVYVKRRAGIISSPNQQRPRPVNKKSVVARITTLLKHCYAKTVVESWRNMLQQVELASTFFNKFFICCSYYHPRNKFLRNKIWETSSDWSKIALQHRSNFLTSTKMAAGENELILLHQSYQKHKNLSSFGSLKAIHIFGKASSQITRTDTWKQWSDGDATSVL